MYTHGNTLYIQKPLILAKLQYILRLLVWELIYINFEWIDTSLAWIRQNILAIKKFFLITGTIAGVAIFLSVGITAVLLAFDDGERPPQIGEFDNISDDENDEFIFAIDVSPNEDEENEGLFRLPARTNFLLVGLDNQLLADAIMVGTFYRVSGNIHLMSVPRDMIARIPAHRMERMRADGIHPPQTLKINEIRSHGGRLHGIYYLQEQIEEMFGVDFNFYVEVEIPAFRRIVDAIGGVYMNVPRRLFYESLDQNPPLRINVPAGYRRLDGNMAEGVVRYRQWPMGDLTRNEMQMEFMTNLISQATTREALLADPLEMIDIVLSYVRSNIGVSAAMYIPYIPQIDTGNVTTFTLPGTIGRVGNREFFIPNTTLLPSVISDVFYSVFNESEDEPEELIS